VGATEVLCRAHFAGIARVKTTLDRELKELGCLTKRLAGLVQPGQLPERVKCERESGYKTNLVDELKDDLAKLMADQNDWVAERANLYARMREYQVPR